MKNEQDSSLVLTLDDASASLARVGGKGSSLARLAADDLPVPPGFHVTTTAYRLFVAKYGWIARADSRRCLDGLTRSAHNV